MARPRQYETRAEQQQAYRERQREREAESRVHWSIANLMAAARAGRLTLTDAEEQRIRDEAGYSQSERRTLAERDAAARRMVENMQGGLSKTAFPHVRGRDPESSWSLAPKVR